MILTPDQRLRVFVSSTLDLHDERAAIRAAIESLGLIPVMFEAGARPHPPRALYRAYVEQSEVFVAIYSRRYGWIAPGMTISGLDDEFELSEGKPRLVYVQAGVDREPELDRFLERVRAAGLSYKPFAAADELEGLVRDDLVVLLTERFHDSDEAPRAPGASLPSPLTPVLGRETEVADILAQLDDSSVRLVTLVGPGGVGKTRLGIDVAHRWREVTGRDVYYVPLEGLHEAALVADEIASALGASTSDAMPAVAAVAALLGDRPVLLVLDNFEQVIDAAPTVSLLLEACPGMKVLATSRSPLRVRGEHEVDVVPLPVNEEGAAVELFIAAARSVRPGYRPQAGDRESIAELCRQLDGLPLALELAAAQVRLLTPAEILERIRAAPSALTGGSRDLPERQRTLSDTIRWSYELLDEGARELFARLSVFRGGFSLDRAQQVCGSEMDVFAGIEALAEQSLVRTDLEPEAGVRFSMLATITSFASDLLAPGDADAIRERHAAVFADLAESVGRPKGRSRSALLDVELELDNIRAAFAWLLASGEPDRAAGAMGESWWFWWMRGFLPEGLFWIERALEAQNLGDQERGHALTARGLFFLWSGRYEMAVASFTEAAAIVRSSYDDRMSGWVDIGLGLVQSVSSSVAEGKATIERGVASLERAGDPAEVATGLASLCWVQGTTREFDDDDHCFRRTLELARATDSWFEMGIAEGAWAQYRMTRGESDEVPALLISALTHVWEARHIGSTIMTLEIVAEFALGSGLTEPATRIIGATNEVRSRLGTRTPPAVATRLQGLEEAARRALGESFTAAKDRGASTELSEVVEDARSLLERL